MGLGGSSGPSGAGGGNSGGGVGGGDGNGRDANVNLPPVNQAPTDITLSNNWIREKKRKGTRVGLLSTIDSDSGIPFTYQLLDSAGGAFRLEGDALIANREFDYEKDNAYSIRVEVQDSSGKTYQKQFTIRINDLKSDNNRSISSAGNSLNTSFYLGDLTNAFTRKDSIGFIEKGKRDKDDYISFNLVQNGSLTVNLSKLKADADFKVLDASGNIIGQSQTNGRKSDIWTSNSLSAGTYTIQVEPGKAGVQTRYTLSLSTTPNPTPILETSTEIDPNGTFETGALNFDLGVIPVYDPTIPLYITATAPLIKSGAVGTLETYGRDLNDYYEFTLASRSSLAVSLSGLTADADLEIYDSNFTLLGQSKNSGTQSDTLLGYDFAAGTYYAHVTPYGDAQVGYDLSLIADTAYEGFGSVLYTNPYTTGKDQYLGTLNTTHTDAENSDILTTSGYVYAGSDEFYGFRVGSFSGDEIYISLFTPSDGASLEIYNSAFQELYYSDFGTYDPNYGDYYETVPLSSLRSKDGLTSGEIYYARVVPLGSNSTSFTLNVHDVY